MPSSRRDFLKIAATGAGVASVLGFDLAPAYAELKELKISHASETRSTCPYCSVSCGVIIYTLGDKARNSTAQVIHVEGDPDHPINKGTLCPKGASLYQDILNERRLTKPEVRRPGSDHWEDISWGRRDQRDRRVGEENARRHVYRKRREGQHGEPLRIDRVRGRLHRYERI